MIAELLRSEIHMSCTQILKYMERIFRQRTTICDISVIRMLYLGYNVIFRLLECNILVIRFFYYHMLKG